MLCNVLFPVRLAFLPSNLSRCIWLLRPITASCLSYKIARPFQDAVLSRNQAVPRPGQLVSPCVRAGVRAPLRACVHACVRTCII